MKNSAILVLVIIFSLTAFAQKPKPAKKSPNAAPKPKVSKPVVNLGDEKEEFEKAVALTNALERIAALQKFIENFPKSAEKTRAQELIVSARAQIGDEKLRLNEIAEGVEYFKLAVKDAPQPMSDKIFNELILNFPTNLFWNGQRTEAVEIARLIETKADGNAKQLLGLATYYLGTENASEAKRIAEKAIALDPALPAAYQTLGLAHRLNFQLEESANAYAKALELDTNSLVSKRSLAEMKRATGKPDEAAALYREILEKDAADGLAQTGLILSLFGAEKRTEAEAEMNKSFEANPNNLVLLVGAAYWYAAHGEGAKAVELAQQAVKIEPRYTWAHIALARGFLQQKRPLDAERTLLAARQYGNFPTLDYEIASARLQAGFFREASDILKTNFTVTGDTIKTNLGGRVSKEAANFTELLALERRASIFEPVAADSTENADKLKNLLILNRNIASATDEEIASAADEFVKGDDKMKLHRGLFAANLLLQNKKALPKALELAQAAVGKTDAALEVSNASAAVLADELYESRTTSMSRNQFIIVPEVPRQTLSAILRGRIEEITGWAFYQQSKPAEAAVRLKRAVSVLPEKSAWWRSSMWRLGAALEADGKDKDALDSYIKSYPTDAPDGLKYIIIESLYKKVNGSTDGLETKIGVKPASAFTASNEIVKTEKTETAAQNTESADKTPPPNSETAEPKTEIATTTETNSEPKTEDLPANEVKAETNNEIPAANEIKTEPSPQESSNPIAAEKTEITNESAPVITTEEKPKNEEKSSNEIKTEEVAPTETSSPTETSEQKETSNSAPTTETPLKPEETSETKSEIVTENPTVEQSTEKSEESTETNTATQILPNPELSPAIVTETKTGTDQTKQTETPETKTDSPSKTKSLFEPIIITIPKTEIIKTPNPKTSETNPSVKTVEPATSKTTEETPDENIDAGLVRRRVIEENQACELVVSQENVSLLNGGGSLGILVGFEKSGDLKQIKAVSSSPNDLEISFEPEIGELSGRAFFVIKSISEKTGEYKVTFEAPCGKRAIVVKVR